MPYIPENTQSSSGSIKINDINKAFIASVKDLRLDDRFKTYDVALQISFGFPGCPPDWIRRMSIFASFEKDAQGNLIHNEKNEKEVNAFINKMELLGLTYIKREARKIASLKGICIGNKGKPVLEDDSPIQDIASLIELLSKGKTYELYINKKNKYDNIAAYCDVAVMDNAAAGDPDAKVATERFMYYIDNATKDTAAPISSKPMSPQSEEPLIFVPGA